MKVVLISTYELGRQPFGLASPAAWLRAAGHTVTCADLAVGNMPVSEIRDADFIGFYLPMHTATRLAVPLIERVRALNASARLCCYGLYAALNADYLTSLGVQAIVGGEFEAALAAAVEDSAPITPVSLERLRFLPPDRQGLPVLARYPKLVVNGRKKRAGSTEASRGCKHFCRHCPIVPIYDGTFRIVQPEVVLADIRQQVRAGAEHISFGDPDFFNGPGHARRLIEALHAEWPELTYDVTIKIEHLVKHAELVPILKRTGCLFITSAVESVDDAVLHRLAKGHTRADFEAAVRLLRQHDLALSPTFIPFTPWTTRDSHAGLLEAVLELDLVEAVAPVQFALRLLIPGASRLLELEEIRAVASEYDAEGLVWKWRHPDPAIDALCHETLRVVHEGTKAGLPRRTIFAALWNLVHAEPLPPDYCLVSRATIPYLEEPWFC